MSANAPVHVVPPTPAPEPNLPLPTPPPPSWAQVIPASYGELMASVAGIALLGVVCWLALGRTEAAVQTVVSAFMIWIGWSIRGRVEAAKNEPRAAEPKPPGA